jgi:Concanavalin A-like lectin/glucanases superfamily
MKKILLTVAVSVLGFTGVFGDDTMVLDMPFSDDSGVTDNSPCKISGIFAGEAAVSDNALQLGSGRSRVVIKGAKDLVIGQGKLSVVVSFKLSGEAKGMLGLITTGALSDKDAGYAFLVESTKKKLILGISNGTKRYFFYASSSDLKDGKWHTAAFSYAADKTVILVLDGTVLAERNVEDITATMTKESTKLQIGCWGSGYYLKGSIKNVKMYNSALTSQQLTEATKVVAEVKK